MRECSQCECVFVRVLALTNQFAHEIAATHVVNKVAELCASERVIAKVLDDGPAVGVSMGLFDLVFSQRREPLQKQRTYLIFPKQIDDLFVSQDGVREGTAAA